METIIVGIFGIIVGILAVIFGGLFNRRGVGRTRHDLDRAGGANRRAGTGVRVSRDAVSRSRTRNIKIRSLLKRGRVIIDRARERAEKKDDNLGDG